MHRYYSSEELTPDIVAKLRWRLNLRRVLVAALLAFGAVGIALMSAHASLASYFAMLAALFFLVAFSTALYLLWGACPRCGDCFSPRSFVNFFVFPWPSCFASECASCGVPLGRHR